MAARSVEHATFTIERTYGVSPSKVFACFADPRSKARWYLGGEGMETTGYELDFRVGGRERSRGGPPGGPVITADGRYEEIVPDERIVSTYAVDSDGTRISVSVLTVELTSVGTGTRLTLTEQGAYLDGNDKSEYRQQGITSQLDELGELFESGADR